MFDWRQQAEIPLDQPAARRSMVELAGQIAGRLADLKAAKRPLQAPAETGTHIGDSARTALAEDPGLAAGIPGNWKREAPTPRRVLWADDNPDNNLWERKALQSYGMQFELVRDTDAAMQAIREKGPFSAIISDLGRVNDAQAGLTLLKQVRESRIQTPYFIYTSRRAAVLLRPVIGLPERQGVTADPDALVEMIVAATR